MPYLEKDRRTSDSELDTTSRIIQTVNRQLESYGLALEKVALLRKEIARDARLRDKLLHSPETMIETLEERGIPAIIGAGMAAEEFKRTDFPGGELGLWTWDCCCTGCCITCITTNNLAAEIYGREVAINKAAYTPEAPASGLQAKRRG